MGIWSALTFQGKLAVAAAVLVGLAVLGYAYGDDRPDTSLLNSPGFVTPIPRQAQAVATTGPVSSPTPAVSAGATTVGSVAGTATPGTTAATATATSSGASQTATAPPPTQAPALPTQPPTPVPPTATPAPACVAEVSVVPSTPPGTDRLTARLTCAGAPFAGSSMNGVFTYQTLSYGCNSISDATGSASCVARAAESSPGLLVSVEVCFTNNGKYCATAKP